LEVPIIRSFFNSYKSGPQFRIFLTSLMTIIFLASRVSDTAIKATKILQEKTLGYSLVRGLIR
jgi:hypothetical protein